MKLKELEKDITDFSIKFLNYILFFLSNSQKSLIVSIFHYIIFILGFYYFFFKTNPGDIFRILFFIFIILGTLSYFIFNRCILTSIELKLSSDKNIIQKTIDKYFGSQTEGNITSKIVLTVGSIITGIILLKDYGFIYKINNK
jgi:hypothetical protein